MTNQIALVATGSAGTETETKQAADEIKKRYGVKAVFDRSCFESQPAAKRAEILLGYLLDPKIDVIWAIRGGEGTADLLPYLETHAHAISEAKPKLLIGFSDYTPLLVYFSQKHSWPCIHGMGALQFIRLGPDELSIAKTDKLIQDFLQNRKITQTDIYLPLRPLNSAAESTPKLEGKMIGGNLTLCSISIKDCWEIQTKDKILFFEDWMEKGYRVARTLKYLRRVGLIEHANALILGDFFAKPLGETPEQIQLQTDYFWQVMNQFALSLNIPVFHTVRIGHGKANDPVLLGQKVVVYSEAF